MDFHTQDLRDPGVEAQAIGRRGAEKVFAGPLEVFAGPSSSPASGILRRSVRRPKAPLLDTSPSSHRCRNDSCDHDPHRREPVMTAHEIRQHFLRFFEERQHTIVPSSPVVPLDDPTLLFTNAGMNQFKDVFLGTATRDYRRAADTQKCIRAGGKHNDLDDVGHDTYHHTFFEMLGSWSFGDYFKEDAIRWAWQLLHEELGIPAERLHATYFGGDEADGLGADDEARELWLDVTSIAPEHVHPFSKADNFWEMGETGPCGPCSEIHVDLTPDLSGRALVNADDPRVIEVWNLVFIQFERQAGGSLLTLPAQHVDTGMGFERLVAVLQGFERGVPMSNYDTDVFSPLMEAIRAEADAPAYGGRVPVHGVHPDANTMRDITYRILADHLRCLSFAIADGALPDNTGRGYVLRRILRRAYRYGRQVLGLDRPFLHRLVPALVDQMSGQFPELRTRQGMIIETLEDEEQSFARTLDTGLKLFAVAADAVQSTGGTTIDGDTAFRLHDTYGFPIDLTTIIAGEQDLAVDLDEYERLMAEAKERARSGGAGEAAVSRALVQAAAARNDAALWSRLATDDVPKYDDALEVDTTVLGWFDLDGTFHDEALEAPGDADGEAADVAIVLRATPFYAEQGGQVGDLGHLDAHSSSENGVFGNTVFGNTVFDVLDTQRVQDTVLHVGRLRSGRLAAGASVRAAVDAGRRRAIMANHTATHLLNFGLRRALGDHVEQRGSLVDEEKTRFDFSHRGAVTTDEVRAIEDSVTETISAALPVHDGVMDLDAARGIYGLRAVFGEKYPDQVRVVSVGPAVDEMATNPNEPRWADFSVELCGGTHVRDTAEIERFALVSEEAVAKGVRRVVGVSGEAARHALAVARRLDEQADALDSAEGDDLVHGVAALNHELQESPLPIVRRAALAAKVTALQERVKNAQRAAAAEEGAQVRGHAETLLDQATTVGDTTVVVGEAPDAAPEQLREGIDWLRQKSGSAAVMLFAPSGGKVVLLAGLTADLVERGLDARQVLREAGKIVGGGGGGKPDLAQGGGKKPEQVAAAIEHVRAWLVEQLR
ncbi:MAG: alanine--tRNA ligase [Acidobacteriota bacterium]